jgi:chaperonin cofactor prefoldin
MTQEEIIESKNEQYSIILDRESKLSSTDYIAAKIAEDKATQKEYAGKIAERQQWRDDINEAQDAIKALDALEPEPDERPAEE